MADEAAFYDVNITKLNLTFDNPTTPLVVSALDVSNSSADVESTILPTGSPTLTKDTGTNEWSFKLPKLVSLTKGRFYEVVATFEEDGQTVPLRWLFYCVR